jgi:hypothetical protein
MARFYTHADPPALIRSADPGDPPEVPTWSFFDRVTGAWQANPKSGRAVINGDAEPLTPADAARLAERLGVKGPPDTREPAS